MNQGRALWGPRARRYWIGAALALLGALAISTTAIAQSNVREAKNPRDYTVGPPSNFPEGVIYDRGTRAFYGGSTTDGTLYKQTLDAPPTQPAEVFLPAGAPDGRTAALGVNVDDEGRLYVAGGESGILHVYDLKTRALVARFDTGQGGFINDVDITEDGDVYFTDSFRPFIFRVTEAQVEAGTGTPEAIPLAPEVTYQPGFNANGIRAAEDSDDGDEGNEDEGDDESDDGDEGEDGSDRDILIFDDTNGDGNPPPPADDGDLYRLSVGDNPATREIRRIQVRNGRTDNPDGLELDEQTLYVVNNRQELIIKVEVSEDFLRGRVVSNTTTRRFQTPTTISFAPDDRLLVSNAEFFDGDRLPPFFVTSIKRP